MLISLTGIANENKTIKYVEPIKIENIQEAFVNIPANVVWFKTNETDSIEIINIRSNNDSLMKHIQYNIDGDKIYFNSDIYLEDKYDLHTESPINICIYSKNDVKIRTNKRDLLILPKNSKVLTNEK